MKTKTKSLILIICYLLSIFGTNAIAFAVDDNTPPPEIKIESPPPSININTACAENTLIDNDSRLCQNGSYILCDGSKEGIKSKDSARECKSGKWTQISTQNPNPPGNGSQTGNPGQPGSSPGGNSGNPNPPKEDKIKITKSDVYPKGFNPTVNSAKITYTLNKEAIIEIKIVDSSGQTVTKLIEDKKISKGEYAINWYGTADNKQSGTVLSPGTYEYKITAKNPSNNNVEDTEDGEINLIYFNPDTNDNKYTNDNQYGNFGESNKPPDIAQAKATQTLQNSTTGITAKTGPDTIIYFIILLIGPTLYKVLTYKKSKSIK